MSKQVSFMGILLRVSVVFFIVVIAVKLLITMISKDVMVFIKSDEFVKYVIGAAIFSIIYGAIMARYQKLKHKKK